MTTPEPNSVADALEAWADHIDSGHYVARGYEHQDNVDNARTAARLLRESAGTADRLAAERDAAIARAEESALRSIEARNPGIDMDEVRASRAVRCACGQPATTTHAGIPTCGDDR